MAAPKSAPGGTSSAPVSSAPNPAASPADLDAYVRSNYPQVSWALEIPELHSLLTQAATEQWDPGRLQGALLKTNWYTSRDDAQRNWQQLLGEDPAQATKLYTNAFQKVQQTAAALGITVNPADLSAIAHDVAQYQQSDPEIKAAIVNRGTPNVNGAGGYAQAAQTVKARANEFMVPLSDTAAGDWAKRMLTGSADQQTLDGYLVTMAKSRFNDNQFVTNALDQGFTSRQVFDPYAQQTAQLLDVSPDQVDLNDPKWSAMIDSVDGKGVRRPMTLSEAAQFVRQSTDYAGSANGKAAGAKVAEQLAQTFGKVA